MPPHKVGNHPQGGEFIVVIPDKKLYKILEIYFYGL
jgi:hypothetical protein